MAFHGSEVVAFPEWFAECVPFPKTMYSAISFFCRKNNLGRGLSTTQHGEDAEFQQLGYTHLVGECRRIIPILLQLPEGWILFDPEQPMGL